MAENPAPKRTQYVREFPKSSNFPDLDGWVGAIYDYVEREATEAISWYIGHTRSKRWFSRAIRFSAIGLGGIAGLLPVIQTLWPSNWWRLEIATANFNLTSSLLIGLVALVLALDSFGDFSRGWMRYMLTAFEIRASLQEFRLTWASTRSKIQQGMTPGTAESLLQIAKAFVLKVEQLIGEETRQWATEFAHNLAQMEKEVAARWEERQKDTQAQQEAAKPGAIQLTVTNAKLADGRQFDVVLQSGDGCAAVKDTVAGAETWVRSPVAPGVYTIGASGTIKQGIAAASKVIQVKPAEVREVSLTLLE